MTVVEMAAVWDFETVARWVELWAGMKAAQMVFESAGWMAAEMAVCWVVAMAG